MFHLISLQINELIWTRCTCTCIKKFDRACAGSPPSLKCGFKGSHFSTKVGWDKEKLSRVFHLNGLQINALIWTRRTCTCIKKFVRSVLVWSFYSKFGVEQLLVFSKLNERVLKTWFFRKFKTRPTRYSMDLLRASLGNNEFTCLVANKNFYITMK